MSRYRQYIMTPSYLTRYVPTHQYDPHPTHTTCLMITTLCAREKVFLTTTLPDTHIHKISMTPQYMRASTKKFLTRVDISHLRTPDNYGGQSTLHLNDILINQTFQILHHHLFSLGHTTLPSHVSHPTKCRHIFTTIPST